METVRVRDLSNDEGDRLLGIFRKGNGSVVTWHRAQMVLWSAKGWDVNHIADLAFTSEEDVATVIQRFNSDGLGSLHPSH
jgi:hypothetical protein